MHIARVKPRGNFFAFSESVWVPAYFRFTKFKAILKINELLVVCSSINVRVKEPAWLFKKEAEIFIPQSGMYLLLGFLR